jgi:hypothetical protein
LEAQLLKEQIMGKTLKEKAEENGLTIETVRRRMKNGWTEKKALTTPLQTNKSHKKIKVEIPAESKKPLDVEKYEDGFILTISLMLLGAAIVGILWLLTK